jgi:hypothetical protein
MRRSTVVSLRLQLVFLAYILSPPTKELPPHFKIRVVSGSDKMRLHHSPDVSTFPGFKLMCFVYMIYFSKRRMKCTSF